MPRKLPSLSALRAFEAAARHCSFKRAAAELAVTPTAISHQIRALEEVAGIALFDRRTRKVTLTVEGAQLYPVLREGFDAFAAAMDRLRRPRTRAQVTISATIAFTTRWLVPRLAGFRAAYPDIDLQLHASDDVIDLAAANVDIAVRYGEGPYPGFAVTPLFADEFAPVFNPILAVETVEVIAERPLIDFEWRRQHPNNPTWLRWFAAAGLPAPKDAPALRFSEESHAIQAAVAGQGVALVSLQLVKDELAAMQLVQPFGLTISGYRHHLLTRTDEADGAVRKVCEWLRTESTTLAGQLPHLREQLEGDVKRASLA